MKRFLRTIAVMLWAAPSAVSQAPAINYEAIRLEKVVTAVRITEPITLDGQLEEPAWNLAADGIVAYTAICTHTGCEVDDWLPEEQLLHCQCHSSRFDPRDSARVVDGPAPRTLPALPLKVVDGKLVVANPFTSRVGFESA